MVGGGRGLSRASLHRSIADARSANLIQEPSLALRQSDPDDRRAAGGFLIGNFAAILVAILFVHVRLLEKIFFPVAVML